MPYADVCIDISEEDYEQIVESVRSLFQQAHVASDTCRNHAVVTGYDFHLTENGPKLIEINTNAGGLFALMDHPRILSTERTRVHGQFVEAIRTEYGNRAQSLTRVAIVDTTPTEQFLYPEFLTVERLLREEGIDVCIVDTNELTYDSTRGLSARGLIIDLVYFRDTDFLLTESRSRALRAALAEDAVLMTPTSDEYVLLSDKEKLCSFSGPCVLPTEVLTATRREEFWDRRRTLVFKPVDGFASRGVYRGDKISRARFEELFSGRLYVAQERADPGHVVVNSLEGERSMKYDIRAYAYKDQVYVLGARVYDGQVTNLRTQGGGFAPVRATEC